MADTKVKNPVVIVGTKAQVESTTMGENDFAIVTDQEFYTKAEVDELLSSSGASLPILMSVWSDRVINDMSWLRADTFSWQSGDVYKAVYEHLSADLSNADKLYCWYGDTRFYTKSETPSVGDTVYTNTGSDTGWTIEEIISNSVVLSNGYSGSRDSANDELLSYTDVIDGITITYYVAQDGHKICLPDQESNLSALYESTGVAWYYILDTENKQFKLPRTKWGFTGLRDSAGGYVDQDVLLPNITGTITGDLTPRGDGGYGTSGAFTHTTSTVYGKGGSSTTTYFHSISFNASRSSSVYSGNGTNTLIQPRGTQMYLYFYVGNFEQSAIEQTAGFTTEVLNATVANKYLSNISDSAKELMATSSMPSDKYVNLTLGATDSTYIAPADGWFGFTKITTAAGQHISLLNNTSGLKSRAISTGAQFAIYTNLPCKKGDEIKVTYTAAGATGDFIFIYAEGAKHLS